jgi:hypothetical protein
MDAISGQDNSIATSIAHARKLLGDDGVNLSDAEIEIVLRHVYQMAQELIDAYLKNSCQTLDQ